METDVKKRISQKIDFGAFFSTYGITIALMMIIVVAAILEPTFLTKDNLMNVLRNIIVTGLSAFGMTFVFMMGMIDLSVGAIISLCGCVCVTLANRFVVTPEQDGNTILVILATALVGAAVGAINGMLISLIKGRLGSALIITYAMQMVIAAVALLYANGNFVNGEYHEGLYADLGRGYLPIIVFFVIAIILQFLLKNTKFGKNVSFVGANRDCAQMSGVNVAKHVILVFMISGICAALSGFYVTARIGSANPTQGTGYEMNAIAAAVVGGTSMSGGHGSIFNTVIGVLVISVLNNALGIMGVDSNSQLLIRGVIIILAVALDMWNKKRA